jgi:hypothetical protein
VQNTKESDLQQWQQREECLIHDISQIEKVGMNNSIFSDQSEDADENEE